MSYRKHLLQMQDSTGQRCGNFIGLVSSQSTENRMRALVTKLWSQSLDMDAGKGINKDFVYFVGKKPTEASLVKDHDAHDMKVEDFRRPMSMCFILFMITAVSFIVTWYLLKPVAITIAATEILQTTVDMEAAFLPLRNGSAKEGKKSKV